MIRLKRELPSKPSSPVALTALIAVLLPSVLFAAATPARADGPRVAVLGEPGFPFYNVSATVSPKRMAAELKAAGIDADVIDVKQAADHSVLNADRYAAMIEPYGDMYPRVAFSNIKKFHADGGCLILDAVPFSHTVVQARNGDWNDLGHSDIPALFGPDGIGVGGFHFGPTGTIVPAPADPLGLAAAKIDFGNAGNIQTIDPATLPKSDMLVPGTVADGGAPVAVLLVHKGDGFDGAVDFWASHSMRNEDEASAYATEQLMVRGTIAALAQKGALTPTLKTHALQAMNVYKMPEVPVVDSLPNPPRPYPTLQYKASPPARHLYVIDGQHLSHEETVLLASVQGIVNREQPRIYIIWGKEDQFWLDEMRKHGETDDPILVTDPMSVIQTFRSSIKGAVIPDPKVFVTPDVAVDYAGIENLAVALNPRVARRAGLPIVEDLRGRFKDNADALHFVRTELLPRLNQYLSITIDPDLLGTQIDEIIAAKGMAFWVTGPKGQRQPGADMDAEKEELEKTFAALPLDAVVHGYWWAGDQVGLDETPGVSLASRYGKITTVSDYVANFSVTSGVVLPEVKQKTQAPAPPLDRSKVYLAITVTDGDNLCPWHDYFRQFFTDPIHGKFPIAFGMAPTLMDVAPIEMQWYYDHALSTDEFICDVSGVGYVNPADWGASIKDREGAYKAYYQLTEDYMHRADLHTVRLNLPSREAIVRAGDMLPDVQFLMPDYLYGGESPYSAITYALPDGKPVFRGITNVDALHMAGQIRERIGGVRPAFVNAVVVNWGLKLADLQTMLAELGPNYVAVTPTQLNTLYREANGNGGTAAVTR